MKKLMYITMILTTAGCGLAGIIDWDGTQWSKGTLSNTYIDDASVTMTFSDDCDGYTGPSGLIFPSDDFQGAGSGWFIYNQGLWWAAKQSSITLTITFDAPVTNVSFSVYDVDYWDPSIESIQITGDNSGTDVTPQVSVGSALSYNSATQIVTATNGNVDLTSEEVAAPARTDILFEDLVDTIVLTTYGDGTTDQFGVIMGNLSYTVPEPATMILLGLGSVVGIHGRKRRA